MRDAIGGAERDDDLAASVADVSAAAGDADGHAFRHAPQLPRVGRQVGGDHGDDAALVGVVVHLVLGLGQQPSDRRPAMRRQDRDPKFVSTSTPIV